KSGVPAARELVVHFYVALKSKPMVILTGPANSGKVALAESFFNALAGADDLRFQMMEGHAWWAGDTRNVGFCADGQTRLITHKIMSLWEEASQPNYSNEVFMACLTRISPAELNGFFSEVAFQIQHQRLMRLPFLHLAEPLPYPPNLFLVGTMDTDHWHRQDADLLSGATVIEMRGSLLSQHHLGVQPAASLPGSEEVFLRSCIRTEREARRKVGSILKQKLEKLQPLVHINKVLTQYRVQAPQSALAQTLIYLANSWTEEGDGLFASNPSDNLAIALDFAIANTFLAHVELPLRDSAALRFKLRDTIGAQFSYSTNYLECLA
ncbi:MAG: hypothetical protein AAGU11_18235, partial [Syntrophobacteraceae bacterium]